MTRSLIGRGMGMPDLVMPNSSTLPFATSLDPFQQLNLPCTLQPFRTAYFYSLSEPLCSVRQLLICCKNL